MCVHAGQHVSTYSTELPLHGSCRDVADPAPPTPQAGAQAPVGVRQENKRKYKRTYMHIYNYTMYTNLYLSIIHMYNIYIHIHIHNIYIFSHTFYITVWLFAPCLTSLSNCVVTWILNLLCFRRTIFPILCLEDTIQTIPVSVQYVIALAEFVAHISEDIKMIVEIAGQSDCECLGTGAEPFSELGNVRLFPESHSSEHRTSERFRHQNVFKK